jgi:hypothetical protein
MALIWLCPHPVSAIAVTSATASPLILIGVILAENFPTMRHVLSDKFLFISL